MGAFSRRCKNLLNFVEIFMGRFSMRDMCRAPVLQPFLVLLVLMVLLQFSGQGSVTFYTVQIFTVSIIIFIENSSVI